MAESAALVWLRGPGFPCKAVRCASARCSVWDFIHRYCQDQDVPVEYFFVRCNGALINSNDMVQHGAVYSLEPRLCGGKGGFGSMLRALGAQIEKTTNREACRDLSGRRLRDVNHEKAMAEWVKQQAEREAEKEQKRLERLQRKLVEPKHCFTSPDYQQQCHEMAERLEDSVLKGMQAASSKMVSAESSESRKRPHQSETSRGARSGKRTCFWLGVDGLVNAEGSSSEGSDDDSEEAPATSGRSFQVPETGTDGVGMAAEFPLGSQRAGVLSTDSGAPGNLRTRASGPRVGVSEDWCAELEGTSAEQQVEGEMATGVGTRAKTEPESEELRGGQAAAAAQGGGEETKGRTVGARAAKVAPGGGGESVPIVTEESQSPDPEALGTETRTSHVGGKYPAT
ncbi:splicing regulator SDE2 isoform X2 [Dasypus novemcinctus]|uniref:splicing regulator SDE2 isoform X2 n=1 Tax=Dasypus novemcinctus TaxID=9361 RepID=UPI00265E6CD1|nr:splicing regulator SDE2 isoform X2 [Dasypus novemcinctus]